LVLGGTPTFAIHARCDVPGSECSPGTSTLHDASYATKFPDLPFTPAALLITRVISRPRPGRITLDVGHKAVAADPVGARLVLLDVPGATLGGQSEEHLVVELANRKTTRRARTCSRSRYTSAPPSHSTSGRTWSGMATSSTNGRSRRGIARSEFDR
jgi:D-serine deaminase-like pyridoxal phosphate-dependent protein